METLTDLFYWTCNKKAFVLFVTDNRMFLFRSTRSRGSLGRCCYGFMYLMFMFRSTRSRGSLGRCCYGFMYLMFMFRSTRSRGSLGRCCYGFMYLMFMFRFRRSWGSLGRCCYGFTDRSCTRTRRRSLRTPSSPDFSPRRNSDLNSTAYSQV